MSIFNICTSCKNINRFLYLVWVRMIGEIEEELQELKEKIEEIVDDIMDLKERVELLEEKIKKLEKEK